MICLIIKVAQYGIIGSSKDEKINFKLILMILEKPNTTIEFFPAQSRKHLSGFLTDNNSRCLDSKNIINIPKQDSAKVKGDPQEFVFISSLGTIKDKTINKIRTDNVSFHVPLIAIIRYLNLYPMTIKIKARPQTSNR